VSNTSGISEEIKIDLIALIDSGLAGFRRAYAFMGFAENSISNPELTNFELATKFTSENSPPVRINTSDVTPEILKQYKSEFTEWVIGNSLQELVEKFSLFLDDIYYYLLLTEVNPRRSKIEPKMQTFEGKNLHTKLLELSSLNISTNCLSGFETLVTARNCLVHRGGIVGRGIKGEQDFNDSLKTEKVLRLEWNSIELFISFNGKTEPFIQGNSYPIETQINYNITNKTKFFTQGDKIKLNTQELSEICLNFRSASGEILCNFFKILMEREKLSAENYNKLIAIVKERVSLRDSLKR
jgi:hypothetical protein